MKNKLIILLSIFLINFSKAQQGTGELPYTWEINSTVQNLPNYRSITNQLNNYTKSDFVNSQLQLDADNISSELRLYGKEHKFNIDIISDATFEIIDSMRIWRYTVTSLNAEALQLYFSKFNLPEGGKLFIYDEDRTSLKGAFTSSNNPDSSNTGIIKFGCSPMPFQKLIIEYNQHLNITALPELELYSLVHVFNVNSLLNKLASPTTSPCEINIKCPAGYGWDSEKQSVVLMLAYDAGYYGYATGSLINNTLNNGTPYILTAGHTIRKSDGTLDSDYTPSSLMFLFNYETPTCNSIQGTTQFNTLYSVYGSIHLVSKYDVTDYDYALLQLNASKETISQWGVCYSGWDRSEYLSAVQKPFTMIHHPWGNEKSISVSINSDLESVQYYWDVTTDHLKGFYRTKLQLGAMEKGSSGAPIFDNYHRIVAILNGGITCENGVYDNNNYIRLAKFYKSWTDGNFGFWLSPGNPNILTVNSYCPPPDFSSGGSGTTTDPNNNCRTVNFTVNGENTENRIINVCPSDVQVAPKSPNCNSSDSRWFFKRVPLVGTINGSCNTITNRLQASRRDETLFGYWCKCSWLRLFVSIQECDYNLNLVGPEYSEWKFIYDTDAGTETEPNDFTQFNFNGSYAPQGYVLNDNKYYKIKVATLDHGSSPAQWYEHSAYIKTFAVGSSVIQNQIIDRNEVGTDITIINSNAPATSAPLKVAAQNSIKIQSNSTLSTGRYYLQNLDCNNIKGFRTANPSDSSSNENNTPLNHNLNGYSVYYNNHNQSTNKSFLSENFINLYPNPSNEICILKFLLQKESKVSSSVYDINDKKISDVLSVTVFPEGENEFFVNTKNLTNGVYLVKTYIDSKSIVNKLIVNHE